MARASKAENPVVTFMQSSPNLWRNLYYASMKPLAMMASENVFKDMKSAVSDVTGGSAFTDLANSAVYLTALDAVVESGIRGRTEIHRNLQIKKSGKEYIFTLLNRDSSVLQVGSLENNLPGFADLRNIPGVTKAQILGPIFAALKAVGYPVTDAMMKTGMYRIALDNKTLTEQDDKSGSMSQGSGIKAVRSHVVPEDTRLSSSAFKAAVGATIAVDTDVPGNFSVTIDPFIDVTVSEEVFEACVSGTDAAIKPFLALSWMRESVHAGLTNRVTKKWDTAPAVDLRESSRLLGDVRKTHGKARPRVNDKGFTVSESGVPLYVPEIDLTTEYMRQMSQPETTEDGYLSFDENVTAWANKIILVDWFNDVIVYTESNGALKFQYMYGYVKLDQPSEYILLNTPIIDSLFFGQDFWRDLASLVNSMATPEEAQRQLSSDFSGADSYNGGKVTQTFASLWNDARIFGEKPDFVDRGYKRDNVLGGALLKHIFGLELQELPERMRGVFAQVAAYLRVVANKRKEMNIPVMTRLLGLEYVLISAHPSMAQNFEKIKTAAIAKRKLNEPAPLLDAIDVPNMDAGGNLKGYLPHQVRVLSNRFAGVSDASVAAAAGAGKCVVPSTLIPTSKGLLSLRELRQMSGRSLNAPGFKELKGIEVITQQGVVPADATYARRGKTVKTYFSDGSTLEGLPQHKVLTLLSDYDLDYVRLDRMEGQWVPKVIGQMLFPMEEPDLTAFHPENKGKGATVFFQSGGKLPTTMSPKLAELLGLIVAEGWVSPDYEQVEFSNHDVDILNRFDDLVFELFNIRSQGALSDVGTRISEIHARRFVRNLMQDQLGLSKDRKVPVTIRTATQESQSAFLRALFEGDGSMGRRTAHYGTTSKVLAEQVRLMLENFGMCVSIRNRRAPPAYRTPENENKVYSYNLAIAKSHIEVYAEHIGFLSDRKNNALTSALKHNQDLVTSSQNTNRTATGPANYLPLLGLASKVLRTVAHYTIASGFDFKAMYRAFGHRHSISKIFKGISKKPNMTNRYSVNAVLSFLDTLPESVREKLEKSNAWVSMVETLKELSSKHWVQVTRVKQMSRKVVMDLSVPGPHEYAANGIMSHNTLMILSDILKKKEANPEWRPLIITKPRLVAGFISEINFFTKGKVNVVALTPRTMRVMRKNLKIDTFEKFHAWIKSLPNNTIFLTGYTALRSRSKIYNDITVPGRFFMTDVGLPQFLHIIRLIGFEQVQCDESHLIKNMKSLQAQYAYSVMAQAEEKVIASGTQVTNTVMDMLGQGFSINPMIYGRSLDGFKARYELSGGIIDDANAGLLKTRMRSFLQESTAFKEDWAFVLPDLRDNILTATMTPKQNAFYLKLLEEALLELKARIDGKKIDKPKEEKDLTAEGDDDDEDEEDEDDGEDEELDDEGRLLANADLSLAKVEQFVVAPEENEQFRSLADAPGPADLISPLVGLIDAQLDRIYADASISHANNKSAIFGIHRVASRHFMKHSRHASRAILYSAGNEEAIRKFKTEDNIWLLVADSTGLREGENLQMLSYIFDMQAVWSPGDYEQLVSRMYRPDPKGKFNKDTVQHYWCNIKRTDGKPGINEIKLARMISKAVSVARYKYDGDPRWTKVSGQFEDLGMLTMGFDFIADATASDLAPYLEAWADFVSWETSLNRVNREKVAREIEMENPGVKLLDSNGKVLDRNLFVQLAMREAKSTKTIKGSKKAYTPWSLGATPADVHDMDLAILGSQPVAVGDFVVTEFGPGIVQRVLKSRVLVELNGLKKVTLSRRATAIPVSPQGRGKLSTMINNPAVWKAETIGPVDVLAKVDPSASLAPKGSLKGNGAPKTPPVPVTIVKPSKPLVPPLKSPSSPTKPLNTVKPVVEEIYTYLINGFPALTIMDPPDVVYDHGWTDVPAFVTVSFASWAVADKFLDALAMKFYITQNNMDLLDAEMEQFRTGKVMKLTKQIPQTSVRNFFLAQSKAPKTAANGKEIVHPYWVSIDGSIRLAFSKKSHSPTILRWLKAMKAKNPQIKAVTEMDGLVIRIFSNLKEAAEAIRDLGNVLDIPEADVRAELRELQEDIKALQTVKKTPSILSAIRKK